MEEAGNEGSAAKGKIKELLFLLKAFSISVEEEGKAGKQERKTERRGRRGAAHYSRINLGQKCIQTLENCLKREQERDLQAQEMQMRLLSRHNE